MKNEATRDAKIIRQCLRRIERNEAALESATGLERGRLEKMIYTDRGRLDRATQRMEKVQQNVRCPRCGSASQVWTNQITGVLMCHRLGCHISVLNAANEPYSEAE